MIEPMQMQIVIQKFFIPEDNQNQSVIDKATKELDGPLKVPDDTLRASHYLMSNNFSMADLNVASVMLSLKLVKVKFNNF